MSGSNLFDKIQAAFSLITPVLLRGLPKTWSVPFGADEVEVVENDPSLPHQRNPMRPPHFHALLTVVTQIVRSASKSDQRAKRASFVRFAVRRSSIASWRVISSHGAAAARPELRHLLERQRGVVIVLPPVGPERRFQRKIGRVHLDQLMHLCELVDLADPPECPARGFVLVAPDRIERADNVALADLVEAQVTEFRENEILQGLPVLMNMLAVRQAELLALEPDPRELPQGRHVPRRVRRRSAGG